VSIHFKIIKYCSWHPFVLLELFVSFVQHAMKISLTLFILYTFMFIQCQCQQGFLESRPGRRFACDPSRSGWIYTGYKVQYQVTNRIGGTSSLIHTRISYCEGSQSIGMDAYAPVWTNSSSSELELAWGRKICTNRLYKNFCVLLARTTEVLDGLKPYDQYETGHWVGGLYQCPGTSINDGTVCDRINASPVAPLVTDNTLYKWIEVVGGKYRVTRTPAVSTYDPGASFGAGPIASLQKLRYRGKSPPLNWDDFIDNREFQINIGDNTGNNIWDGQHTYGKQPNVINPRRNIYKLESGRPELVWN
jgi:hypothetical protein